MNGDPELQPQRTERGFVLVAVMALITVLLATSAAFMCWSTDEALQSAQAAAAMQAYYLAQMGIVEKGFMWLRTQPANQLPHEQNLPGRQVDNVGSYGAVQVRRLASGGDFWAVQTRFRISAVGTVNIPYYADRHRPYKEVKRMAVLYVEVRNFVDYMYLSDQEMTNFGDRIKFWNGDTLQGRVHSNSQIAIMESPVFYEQVTSTAEDFWRGSFYNPIFLGPDPLFRTSEVRIPREAERLRQGAAEQGYFYDTPGETYRAVFTGASVTFFRWPTGTPFDSTINWSIPIDQTSGTCIFINGPLEVRGVVTGKVSLGSAGTMRLIDDIKYADLAWPRWFYTDQQLQSANVLGLVSEAEIKIANTPANGRENSAGLGRSQTNQNLTSIVITAAVVALGESFTFENQNDQDSGYVFDGRPDDRGQIFLFGSVTQMRRGYVHRTNRGSTGYLKQYKYDKRLQVKRPPCFFDVTDERGHALFNVVQWGRGEPKRSRHPVSDRDSLVVRYN